jgi:hemoglobin
MKKDIENRKEIILLVDTFYNSVQQNNLLGNIFNNIAQINWEKHLPKMYDFWDSILFGKAIYKGNPMLTHFDLQKKTPLQNIEFETWKNLFFETVDNLFEGENANTIKQKAQSIADLMHFKLNSPNPIKII